MTRNYSRYEVVVCPTCAAPINQPCRGGRLRATQTIPHVARRNLVDSRAGSEPGPVSSRPVVTPPVRFVSCNGGEKVMWIKVTVNETSLWINSRGGVHQSGHRSGGPAA
jgi:hypothetical protein